MFVCLALSLGANEDCGRGARGAIISNGRAKRWPGALASNAPRSLESGRRRRPLPFLFSLFPCFPGFSHFRRSLFFALFRLHSFFFLHFSFPSFPAFVSFPPFFMTKTDARLRPLAGPEATRRRGVCRFKSEAIRPGRAGSAESPPPLAHCPLHSLIPCAAAPGRARRFDFSSGGLNRVELARPGRPVRRQEAHCGLGGRAPPRAPRREDNMREGEGKKRERVGAARGKEERRRVAGVPASPKPRPPRCGRALARFFALPIVRFACGRSRANGFSCPKPSPTPCPPRRAESSPRPRRTAGSTC